MKTVIYGIQGGRGSFNEAALLDYLDKKGEAGYQIQYLHTTENVLKALSQGKIDRGQFAIHNSLGGLVEESINEIGRYSFTPTDRYSIKISHALMIHPAAKFEEIGEIMTHPHVIAQCKKTLKQKYPSLKTTSGEGKLLDQALVAKHLAEGKLPRTIATMGSRVLAKLYPLKIVEDELEDDKTNLTTFLLVK